MYRNQKALSIITTMTGWVFLKQEGGGRLLMTRMYACVSDQRLAQAGYTLLSTLSIPAALYYFSSLAERTPDFRHYVGSPPQVATSHGVPSVPLAPQQLPFQNSFPVDGQVLPPNYPDGIQWRSFILESGNPESQLGKKTWVGTFNPDVEKRSDKVIFKLWDAWRYPSRDRDNEVTIYKRLQPLWGVCIPNLLAFGRLDYLHCLVIDHMDVLLHVKSLT
jgi:hypothetical protein